MDKQDILARLRENEAALKARGVSHAALFGSRARGDNRPDSDIDILIDLAPEAPIGVWQYSGLKTYIASLFEGPVNVVSREALKPCVHPAATADAPADKEMMVSVLKWLNGSALVTGAGRLRTVSLV